MKAAPAPGRGVEGGKGAQVKETFREARAVRCFEALQFPNQNESHGEHLEVHCTVQKDIATSHVTEMTQ